MSNKILFSISFHFIIISFFISLFSFEKESRADEFRDALGVAVQEARVQKVYYSDLIDDLDQENKELWEKSRCGTYPGFPGLLSVQPFTVPSQGILMAQESVIFWDSVEYQLEQLLRFYEGLPAGSFKTEYIQNLLLEILRELNQSSIFAFYDLHQHIKQLRVNYHLGEQYHHARAMRAHPRDSRVPQSDLDEVDASLDQIYRNMKENRGINSHWAVGDVPRLESVLVNLPRSLLADQYYFDLKQGVYLTRFLARFYQGALEDLKEVEPRSSLERRWVVYISEYFQGSPNFFHLACYSIRKLLNKQEILLPEEEVRELSKQIKTMITARNFSLAFLNRDKIITKAREIQTLDLQRSGDPQALREEGGASISGGVLTSIDPRVEPMRSSDGTHSPECLEPNQCLDEPRGDLHLSHLSLEKSQDLESNGEGSSVESSLGKGLCKKDEQVNVSLGSVLESIARDPIPGIKRDEVVAAGRKHSQDGSLSAEGEESSPLSEGQCLAEKYLEQIKAEHEHYQSLKKDRRVSHGQGAIAVQTGLELPENLPPQARDREIHLSGNAADTYLTAIGKKAVRQIRNRDIHELVSALGGRLDYTLGDVRIVLPNRNEGVNSPELFFKMHFRHSGAETFPIGTLKAFLGKALERAGLIPWVKIRG